MVETQTTDTLEIVSVSVTNLNYNIMTIQEYHTYRNNLYDLFVRNGLIEDNDYNYSLFDVLLYECEDTQIEY